MMAAGGAGLTFLLFASVAFAATYTLSGDATVGPPGNASANSLLLESTATTSGAAEFDVPAGLTFATLETLSSDYFIVTGDCVGGSPRFQIAVPETGPVDADPSGDNIFVYFEPRVPGDPPCPVGAWTSTGDMLAAGATVDTSQLGGTFYHDYEDAVADFGSLSVLSVSLVADSGWLANQSIRFDNVNIDGDITTFEEVTTVDDKDDCKKGGWQDFTDAPGPFKNQGQCVSHFARMQ
jgi:hypothetical protein